MSESFELAFAACLRTISVEEKKWLEDHHCGVLATLRFAKLDLNFLSTAIHFWDPDTHCFNFRNNEITPLPEELGAIISWPNNDLPCLPGVSEYFYKDFQKYLDLSSHAVGRLVHGRKVDLVKFVEHLMNCDPSRKLYRKRALMFCLFARFLFVRSDPSVGHASLVTIVEQCERGRTPMPLCMGELLISLDRVKRDPRAPLAGCPLLLQIWLMERLNFIEPPISIEKYNPKGLFSRKRLHESLSLHEWLLILSDRKNLIRWTVPWWGIGSMADTHSSPYIRVASLDVLSFYFHVRVRRQYGQRQTIPDSDTLRPLDKTVLRGNARSW